MHLLFVEARWQPRVAEFGRQLAARLPPSLQLAGHVHAESVIRVSCDVSGDVMVVTWTPTVCAHRSVMIRQYDRIWRQPKLVRTLPPERKFKNVKNVVCIKIRLKRFPSKLNYVLHV